MNTLRLGTKELDALWRLASEGWEGVVDADDIPATEYHRMERVMDKLRTALTSAPDKP